MEPSPPVPRHFLHPGTLFAPGREHWATTILGSCVAVCLWDAQLGLGGINHFLLPFWNGEGLATPRYGNIAVEKLLEKMLALGARKELLQAKLFGGAQVLEGDEGVFGVGAKNALVARELMDRNGIPVTASLLGGQRGMKIQFNTRDGTVLVARFAPGAPVPSSPGAGSRG